jgi:outer membrane receptor protein involved in Fe transport
MLFNAHPYLRFDYSYVGDSVNSLQGVESVVLDHPVDKQAAYQLGNLRFGLDGDHWSGSIFIDNLWDERADLFRSNRWGVQRQSVNPPRTYGIQVRYSF